MAFNVPLGFVEKSSGEKAPFKTATFLESGRVSTVVSVICTDNVQLLVLPTYNLKSVAL